MLSREINLSTQSVGYGVLNAERGKNGENI